MHTDTYTTPSAKGAERPRAWKNCIISQIPARTPQLFIVYGKTGTEWCQVVTEHVSMWQYNMFHCKNCWITTKSTDNKASQCGINTASEKKKGGWRRGRQKSFFYLKIYTIEVLHTFLFKCCLYVYTSSKHVATTILGKPCQWHLYQRAYLLVLCRVCCCAFP